MKNEVAQGIKNALERGQTLESAIASFVNAGYSEIDVKEAAESLNNSASALLPLQQAPADSMESQDTPVQAGMFKALPMQNIPSPAPIPKTISSQSTEPMSPAPQISASKPMEAKKEGEVSKTKVIVLSAILFLLLAALVISIFFRSVIFGA